MNNDQLSSAVWFSLGLAVCLLSVQYRLGVPAKPSAGFMPFLAGAGMCLCSLAGFVHATLRRKRGEGWRAMFAGLIWQRAFLVFGSLVAYGLLLKTLGFLLCTTLFIAFQLKAFSPYRWPAVIGGAVLTAVVSYVVFEIWLKGQLPQGFWGI